MKVAHVSLGGPHASVDGIRTAVQALAGAQRALDVEVWVLDEAWRAGRSARATLVAIHAELGDRRIELVHLHSVYRPLHAALAVALRRGGIPFVVSPHSGLSAGSRRRQWLRKALWLQLVERRFLRTAGGVLCLSPVEQGDVLDLEPRARAWVVPNVVPALSGADAATPSPPPQQPRDRPLLVTLSRYDVRQKGLDRLVAMARAMPEVDALVHGDFDANEPRRARELIASAPSNVAFRPPIGGMEKAALLRRASIYVQPSRWEGMSMSVIEAMAAGVPCAVSGYIAGTFGPEGPELAVVLPDDPDAAAVTLREALADTAGAHARAERAGRWVREHLSGPSVARKILDVYREVVTSAAKVETHRW